MSEIVKSLSLNKHPSNVKNYSLVQAKNVKLSNDLTRIVNEEGIASNNIIHTAITKVFATDYFIAGCVPTSNELIIFVSTNDISKSAIFRYNEEDDKCILVNNQWKWSGGKLRGTYTYNINKHLIIQLAEDPNDSEVREDGSKFVTATDIKVPLKTFDFDDWDLIKNAELATAEGIECIDIKPHRFIDERQVNNRNYGPGETFLPIASRFGNRADWVNAIVPQVPICNVTWGGLIKGNAIKGVYSFFIRYKIDCWGNYTQWYPIGYPITVDSIEKNAVSRYNWYFNYKDLDDESGYSMGCVDFYSNDRDFVSVLPKIRFKFEGEHDYLNFQKYQIGIVIKRLDTTKSYRSADFNRYPDYNDNKELPIYEYIFNKEKLYDVSLDELTLTKYNYFNVRNTINYQNRNYISNYTETNYNISEKEIGLFDRGYKVEEVVKLKGFSYTPYVKTTPKWSSNKSSVDRTDECMDEFCFDTNYVQTPDYAKGPNKLDNVSSWEKVKGYDYGTWHRIIGGWDTQSKLGVPLNEILGIDRNKQITVGGRKGPAYKFVLYQGGARESFTWWNEKYSDCYIGEVGTNSFSMIGTSTTITYDDKTITLNGETNWMSAYHPMLDYTTSFESRLAHNTLIPGEVYSFYIHFVDKYGQSTNGFHIPNVNTNWQGTSDLLTQTLSEYFGPNADKNVPSGQDDKNVQLSIIYDIYRKNPSKWKDYCFYQFINNGGNNGLHTNINRYGWYTDMKFGYYANNSGDSFHRVPFYSFTENSEDRSVPLVFGVYCEIDNQDFLNELRRQGYIGYYLSYEKAEPMSRVVGFASETDASEDIDEHPVNHDLDGIPKKEKNKGDYDGSWTYYRGNNRIATGGPDNTAAHSKIYVYSEDLNTNSKIKVDFNAISFRWAQFDYRGFWQDQGTNKVAEYRANLNLPEVMHASPFRFKDQLIYPIDEYNILVGDAPGNDGKGTRVEIPNPGVFNKDNWQYNAIATVWSLNNNIYTNPNKELIRINNITLIDGDKDYSNNDNTFGSYPGHITYNSTLVFRRTGAKWNEQWTTVKGTDGKRYYFLGQGAYNVVSPQRLVQHICYWHRFMEGKVENNKPDQKYFILNIDNQARFDDEKDTKRIAALPNDSLYFHGGPNVLFPGRPVMPIQTLDMYKYVLPDEVLSDKLLLPYDDNNRNITNYNKTIRRSDVIQDESYVNAWRTFQPNGYKIITENKGDIVNLVGIGLYLLAHTEHSMFMFDRTAALQTQDKDVKLAMPDAFDTKYVEVYTSDKGFAGIQDRFASIIGEFGYVFYNNDFHRLFKFDEKQIKYIDEDVRLWFEKALPDKVRFVNDKYNNRLILTAKYGNSNETLSYHNDTNTFISLHDYKFEYGYNTKIRHYMNRMKQGESLYSFEHETNYGRFNNILSTPSTSKFLTLKQGNTYYNSYIDIIFNDQYELIKFLEYIRYKVKKLDVYLDPNRPDNVSSPVEDEVWSNIDYANKKVPAYSGDTLRIFNEYCDTLDMNISIANNPNVYNRYKLPYFELGNWNFNYFRNNIPAHPGQPSDRLRRIYGNQIIVRFVFDNKDNKRIEFETLDCIVTKQRNVR